MSKDEIVHPKSADRTHAQADKLREDADKKAAEAKAAQDAADKAKAEAEAAAPHKSPLERAMRKPHKDAAASGEKKEHVTIQAQSISFAPIGPVVPVFDPAKSRMNEQTKLARGEYHFACQTVMKQAGVTQEQAEDIIEELDQSQANDLVDAANGNRIDHIGRVLAGVTETDAERTRRVAEAQKQHTDNANATKARKTH